LQDSAEQGLMTDNQTRQITEPISYDDGKVFHTCEYALILPELRMIWTKCFIDVPDGQGFPADEIVKVTCMKCIAALGAP
jgi:hypothetical protein